MQRAGIEQCRRGGAKAPALVEIVQTNGVALAVLFFMVKQAHGDTDPEVLWHFQVAVFLTGLIDNQVAVI